MTWLRAIIAAIATGSAATIRDSVILGVSALLFAVALFSAPIASVSAAAGAAGVAWWFNRRKPDASDQ